MATSNAKLPLPGWSVEKLASQYLREIQDVQPQGPYQISGLSFGGLLAFEISRQLAEKGEQVGLVALFDTGNWAYYRNLPADKANHVASSMSEFDAKRGIRPKV